MAPFFIQDFFITIIIVKKSPILATRTTTNNQSQQPSCLEMFEESLIHFSTASANVAT